MITQVLQQVGEGLFFWALAWLLILGLFIPIATVWTAISWPSGYDPGDYDP